MLKMGGLHRYNSYTNDFSAKFYLSTPTYNEKIIEGFTMRFGDLVSIFFSSLFYISIIGLIGGFFVYMAITMIFDLDPEEYGALIFATWGGICVLGVPYIIYASRKAELHCDVCNKDWLLKTDGQTTISENERTEVVEKSGDERNTRRIVTTRVYWQHYICTECSNETKTKCSEENKSAEF
jgi:hypothetical protein